MKTRTLFLFLFISISIFLITSGMAFAETITGCIKKANGMIYNAQTGPDPAYPCHFLDKQVSWDTEAGQDGADGTDGVDGADGQDGADGLNGVLVGKGDDSDYDDTAIAKFTQNNPSN